MSPSTTAHPTEASARRLDVMPAREFFFASVQPDPARRLARELAFFRTLCMANGTYKTTAADRMREVDALLVSLLPRDLGRPLDVLDVGVSSGITTLEFLEAFEAAGVPRRLVAVDITIHARIRRVAPGVDLLLDSAGHVLQIHTPLLTKGRPHDPHLSRVRAALQWVFDRAEATWGGDAALRPGDAPVELLTPRLVERSDVTVVEHDLTLDRREWREGFDVVRAANILNLSYFDEPTLRRMLAHLRSYLRPGGFLLLCRTLEEGGTNHATVLRLTDDDAFTVVARHGGGSEVEALALTLGAGTAV